MPSLGFSNLIVANNDFSIESIQNVFEFVKEHSIRRVIFLIDFDVESDRLPSHLECKTTLRKLLNDLRPYGTSISVETNVIFTKDSAYFDKLHKLQVKHTNHLFLTMLPFDGEPWYDYSMGYLVNHQRLTPCFASFERILLSSEDKFAAYLTQTRPAIFSFDINHFANERLLPHIKYMLATNRVIVPAISGVIDDYNFAAQNLQYFKQIAGDANYTRLLINISKSNKLFVN